MLKAGAMEVAEPCDGISTLQVITPSGVNRRADYSRTTELDFGTTFQLLDPGRPSTAFLVIEKS